MTAKETLTKLEKRIGRLNTMISKYKYFFITK